jgi:hypothetical protein
MACLTHVRHLYNWLIALLYWLLDARIFWIALGVVIWSLFFVIRKGVSEPEIRITGLALQVLGIGTVAWGIRETRALFGRPDILRLARNWFRRAPVYGGRNVSGSSDITLPSLRVQAHGYSSSTATLDATIEERVGVLENNIKHLNGRIDETRVEIDQNSRAQSTALEREKQERSLQDQELSAKLEATETGGLHISAMGALWLFIGVTFSTASVEIAAWLK